MSTSLRCAQRLALAFVAIVAAQQRPAPAQDAASAQAAREWNQPRGDPDLSAGCDVEPILRPPLEAWRLSFKELYADPVCWGGLVFVAGIQQREPMLYVLDQKTGKSAATSLKLSSAKAGWLAVWQGFVAFVQPEGVQILSLRGGQFAAARKSVAIPNPGPPSVLSGQLFVADWREVVHCIDLQQGKELGKFGGGQGQPALVALDSPQRALVATVTYGQPPHSDPNLRYVGQYLALTLCEVQGLGTPAPSFTQRKTRFHSSFEGELGAQGLEGSIPIALGQESGTNEPSWMVFSTVLLETRGGKSMHAALYPKRLFDFRAPPVVVDGLALGLSRGGALLRADPDEKTTTVFEQGGASEGKRRSSSLTRARGVLYLENWALRLEDNRVLWELPTLDLARGLWPIGDGLALYVSAKNELVCLRDPGVEPGPKPAAAAKSARPSLPGSGEGVVLRDGTRIAGSVTRAADGSVELKPAQGELRRLAAGELALVETREGVLRVGPEFGVYRAAAAACNFEYRESLAPQIEAYLQAGLIDEARGLTNLLKQFGALPAELAQYDKKLSGRATREDRNSAGLRQGGQKEEAMLREKSAKRFVESARWCRANSLGLAASVLYADALRVDPARAGVAEEVVALVPPGAPWRAETDAPARWMALARALLPADARVLAPDDTSRKRLEGTIWAADALVLRSPNLELVWRELDAPIVGRVLCLGERAVEVLTHLLGEGQASAGPLDVRLHASKTDYQDEFKSATGRVVEWMAGHYSSAEQVSRFFVSRADGDADLHELERVLVHELAHHFIDTRWVGGPPGALGARQREPGFWIVEGLAEFVSGQVLEMERRGERFDDAEVVAVDLTAQLQGERKLIPIETLLDLDQLGFWKLGDSPLAGIQFRHTLGSMVVTEREIFYHESAALVFYLLNESGKRHAAQLPGYLRSWYRNELGAGSWSALGYAESAELAAGFVAFLEARRKK